MRDMRELWLRVDPSLSKTIKENLLKAGKGKASAVILEGDDLVLAQGSGLKVVSKETQADIFLMKRLDERSLAPCHRAIARNPGLRFGPATDSLSEVRA